MKGQETVVGIRAQLYKQQLTQCFLWPFKISTLVKRTNVINGLWPLLTRHFEMKVLLLEVIDCTLLNSPMFMRKCTNLHVYYKFYLRAKVQTRLVDFLSSLVTYHPLHPRPEPGRRRVCIPESLWAGSITGNPTSPAVSEEIIRA